MVSEPVSPAAELKHTTAPPPAARMCGRTARRASQVPFTLMSNSPSHSASLISVSGLAGPRMPAAVASNRMGPCAAAVSTMAATSAARVASPATWIAPGHSAAVAASPSASRSNSTRRAPRRASRMALRRPSPEAAPVTMPACPSKSWSIAFPSVASGISYRTAIRPHHDDRTPAKRTSTELGMPPSTAEGCSDAGTSRKQ
jgi:hypothetical protein